MAQRFFLGVFEAGVSPAFLSLLGMFYTKREQALRTPILYASNGITIIPLLAISYGLVTIDSIPPWKTIYYFLGALTIVWAVVFGLFVPDSPVAARFLTPRQKFVAVERLRENQAGITNKKFKAAHVLDAAKDVKVWLLFVLTFCLCSPNVSCAKNAVIAIT